MSKLFWLQNWNVNGAANWSTQKAWAEGLNFAGSTDWELPEIGEYAALFTAYGNLLRVAAFTNVQPFYWSGTEVAAGITARFFFPDDGFQGESREDFKRFAVAVRPGG